MFHYKIINKPNINIKTKTIDNIFKTIFNIIDKKQNGTLNIIFLDNDGIKNLNKNYRKIDKTTDVLSFHYYDDFSNIKKEEISWEIVMSLSKIIEQWKTYWLWSEKEFYKLLIHSILHILWYDHENNWDYKLMQEYENIIYNKVFD